MRGKACMLVAGAAAIFLGALHSHADLSTRERARIELGRRLFMDPAVSASGRFSCASCHDPEHGFSDPRQVSEDENGPTRRHSQSVLNLADGAGLHWDGEFDNIRELLVARLAPPGAQLSQARQLHQRHFDTSKLHGREPDPKEFERRVGSLTPPYYGPVTPNRGRPVLMPVDRRIARDGRYAEGFRRAFGSKAVTTDRLVSAMESYLSSLESGESAYDRFQAGDPEALSERARRGRKLFSGKANCASCHVPETDFTDAGYHNTGVSMKSAVVDFGGAARGVDHGRGTMSFVAGDIGKFKTPSLRDVARRPPYMHDGSLATLDDVVDYYDHGGTPNGRLDPAIRPLGLSEEEKGDLVAFLRSLTSAERPGLGEPSIHRPPLTRIYVHDLQGHPIRDLEVEVHPFGDRLRGAGRDAAPLARKTDRGGRIEFAFPPWTHVRLTAKRYELGLDQPIPDSVRTHKVMAVSRDRVVLRLTAPKGVNAMPRTLKASARGKTVAVFRRVRTFRTNEALYVAREAAVTGFQTVEIDYAPRGGVAGLREIDFSGGETEPIDLRR